VPQGQQSSPAGKKDLTHIDSCGIIRVIRESIIIVARYHQGLSMSRNEETITSDRPILRYLQHRINRELRLTLLGFGEAKIKGWILAVSSRGLDLLVQRAIQPGQPLKAEVEDYVLLGEVSAVASLGGAYRVWLEVEQFVHTTSTTPNWATLR